MWLIQVYNRTYVQQAARSSNNKTEGSYHEILHSQNVEVINTTMMR